MPHPVERVVIHSPAVFASLPAPPSPPPPESPPLPPTAPSPAPAAADPPDLSTGQQRELDGLFDMLRGPVRRQIILALAAGGPDHVGALAKGTHISQKLVSHHLGHLRTAGLVYSRRKGKCIEYETADHCVHYRRRSQRLFLTLTSYSGDVILKISVKIPKPPAATNPPASTQPPPDETAKE